MRHNSLYCIYTTRGLFHSIQAVLVNLTSSWRANKIRGVSFPPVPSPHPPPHRALGPPVPDPNTMHRQRNLFGTNTGNERLGVGEGWGKESQRTQMPRWKELCKRLQRCNVGWGLDKASDRAYAGLWFLFFFLLCFWQKARSVCVSSAGVLFYTRATALRWLGSFWTYVIDSLEVHILSAFFFLTLPEK